MMDDLADLPTERALIDMIRACPKCGRERFFGIGTDMPCSRCQVLADLQTKQTLNVDIEP